MRTPKFPTFDELYEGAQAYWQLLPPQIYRDRPLQYGHPIVISQALAKEIANAANSVEKIVLQLIHEAGGVTPWLEDHAPKFGNESLNYPAINQQLEQRMQQGYELPFAYDIIVTSQRGRPTCKVVEIQTGISYLTWPREMLRAAGDNPDSPECWYGIENPLTALRRVKQDLANGEEVTVIDTNPYAATQRDQIGMTQELGDKNSLPISPMDIKYDEKGYYYDPYEVDQETGGPIKVGDNYRKTGQIKPIKHVLSRMTQPDLDKLNKRLEDNPTQRALVLQFFQDARINWIWHPAWQSIVDKSSLSKIRRVLELKGDPLIEHFVPIFGPGETLPIGTFVRKPTNAVSGEGQSVEKIEAERVVEDGFVYQKRFFPYPFRVKLPEQLKNAFPMPEKLPLELIEHFGLNNGYTFATLELRFLSPPGCKRQLSGLFLGRLAPRYSDPKNRDLAKTNMGAIIDALYTPTSIQENDHKEVPFGICPVRVQKN